MAWQLAGSLQQPALQRDRRSCPCAFYRRATSLISRSATWRTNIISRQHTLAMAAAAMPAQQDIEEFKSEDYSKEMNEKMGSNLIYRHEVGMNYHHITDDIIVGSCLQTPADVDRLAEQEGVGTVFCLQQDSDMAYFGLDIEPIQQRSADRGDIKHVRFPIRDFDPCDLRLQLPAAVRQLRKEMAAGRGKVYVHCTAGMGRAPGVALAHMFWCEGWALEDAHKALTSRRACNPSLTAIREATCDLLFGGEPRPVTIAVHRWGAAQSVQLAGLDVGWGQRLDFERNLAAGRFELRRELPPGRYQYKLLLDGLWTASADHPTLVDNDNVNNYVEVVGSGDPAAAAARKRLLAPGGNLDDAERKVILCKLSA